jgi:hypothetical protein
MMTPLSQRLGSFPLELRAKIGPSIKTKYPSSTPYKYEWILSIEGQEIHVQREKYQLPPPNFICQHCLPVFAPS